MSDYGLQLKAVGMQFATDGASFEIIGDGVGQFLVATRDDRGVELYKGDSESEWYIDPAFAEELQGEVVFSSLEAAVGAARKWLSGADRNALRDSN